MPRIAHISDLHIPCEGDWPWSKMLFNKRSTGAVNLLTFRSDAHPFGICEELFADLNEQDVDHVILTGDLTNLSLEEEFERAHDVLSTLGDGRILSLVPGNHDKYVRDSVRDGRFEAWFGKWLHGGSSPPDPYPYTKHVAEGVHLMGLCSAIPTPPFMSWGRIGEPQMKRMQSAADKMGAGGDFRIAALHHNLHRRGSSRKDWSTMLKDRDVFIDALFEARIDLVLHGHTHVANRMEIVRGEQKLSIVGCGSSTWQSDAHPARYNVYSISGGALDAIHCRIRRSADQGFEADASPLTIDN